jgi:MFS transporter, OFA family, oxalate/formate antiporter
LGQSRYPSGIHAVRLAETWLVPLEAYFVDRYGPRLIVGIGGILVAIAWIVNSRADSLVILYAGSIIGGVGAGIVYGIALGQPLKPALPIKLS